MLAAIIQATMDSTRLPGKTLVDIAGKPMLWHLIDRVRRVKEIDEIIIATTQRDCDLPIRKFAHEHDVNCFWYPGGREDVLDRVYQAAKIFPADGIVRVTPDCPLIDPVVISGVARAFLDGDFDYMGNVHPRRTYPKGLDVEIFSFKCLEHIHQHAETEEDREGWNPYLLRNYKKYRTCAVEQDIDMGHLHWCVDTQEDLDFVREVFGAGGELYSMWRVLEVIYEVL